MDSSINTEKLVISPPTFSDCLKDHLQTNPTAPIAIKLDGQGNILQSNLPFSSPTPANFFNEIIYPPISDQQSTTIQDFPAASLLKPGEFLEHIQIIKDNYIRWQIARPFSNPNDANSDNPGFEVRGTDVTYEVKHNQELEYMATHDPVTGLHNRSYFDKAINEERERIENNQESRILGVIVIDLVDFKKFNDRYGHDVGDKVLKFVAQALKKSVRNHDICARFGGDELAIILNVLPDDFVFEPNDSRKKDIVNVAIASIEDRFASAISDRITQEPNFPKVEISIGGAVNSRDPEQAIKDADAEMYLHKNEHKLKAQDAN